MLQRMNINLTEVNINLTELPKFQCIITYSYQVNKIQLEKTETEKRGALKRMNSI